MKKFVALVAVVMVLAMSVNAEARCRRCGRKCCASVATMDETGAESSVTK